MQEVVTWICWGLVIAVWIVGAFGSRRPARRLSSRSDATWRFVVVVVAVVVYRVARHDFHRLTTHSSWVELPGLVLLAASTSSRSGRASSLGTMRSRDARHVVKGSP